MDMVALTLCIGHNMWFDKNCQWNLGRHANKERDFVYFEKIAWDNITQKLPELGVNTVFLDMAEGVAYDCAPELALPGTIGKKDFKAMLDELRQKGITPLPKLDFSAAHDLWMGDYGKMTGTDAYRAFCAKLIEEVCDLFDGPAYFHLGLADENLDYQQYYGLSVMRGPKVFWKDVNVMFDACRKKGAKPVIFDDYAKEEPQAWKKMLPADVAVAIKYFGRIDTACDEFDRDQRTAEQKAFEEMCKMPNEKILVGKGVPMRQNITDLFYYAKNHPEQNITGVLSYSELPTVDLFDYAVLNEAMRLGKGMEAYRNNDF